MIHYESLFQACRELFGEEVCISHDFLHYLQPCGIKSAFRRKAKETHPDAHFGSSVGSSGHAEGFRKARSAYDLLNDFLSQRERSYAKGPVRGATTGSYTSSRRDTAGFFEGSIPQSFLQIGRYLYYRQVITFRDLLHALAWQRSNRKRIGTIARSRGWLGPSEVNFIMSSAVPGRFGEKAVKLGLLNDRQVKLLLLEQKSTRQLLGQYFIQNKLLTPNELDILLRDLRRHNFQVRKMPA